MKSFERQYWGVLKRQEHRVILSLFKTLQKHKSALIHVLAPSTPHSSVKYRKASKGLRRGWLSESTTECSFSIPHKASENVFPFRIMETGSRANSSRWGIFQGGGELALVLSKSGPSPEKQTGSESHVNSHSKKTGLSEPWLRERWTLDVITSLWLLFVRWGAVRIIIDWRFALSGPARDLGDVLPSRISQALFDLCQRIVVTVPDLTPLTIMIWACICKGDIAILCLNNEPCGLSRFDDMRWWPGWYDGRSPKWNMDEDWMWGTRSIPCASGIFERLRSR